MTHQRTALVVEDEPLLCSLIGRLLGDSGFTVVEAGSAIDAFGYFTQTEFDLIVADIDLGAGPNGIDVVQRIRAQSPGIGVVFLTNLRDPRVSGKTWSAIPRDAAYIVKSELGSPNALNAAVASALSPKNKGSRPLPESSPLRNLSDTQVSVLAMVAKSLALPAFLLPSSSDTLMSCNMRPVAQRKSISRSTKLLLSACLLLTLR